MRPPAQAPGGATLGLFFLAVLLGGSNFLAVRLSNLDLPPFWGAGLRFALAALGFLALVGVMRLPLPRGRTLLNTVVYGLLSIAAFYGLMYWSLLTVTAGVATVVLALVPLATVLLAAAQRLEPFRMRSVLGGAVAVVGIAWLALEPGRVTLPAGPLFALLGAVLCVSQSVILAKRLAGQHPAVTNTVAAAVGAVALLLGSAAVGETWSLPQRAEAAWALAYLVTLGSVGLFLALLTVVQRWTASATSYVFVLFPVATMVLEAILLGEPITWTGAAGALLVMTGVWVGALAPRRPVSAVGATPTAE